MTAEDVDRLHDLDADPVVMRYVSGGRPTPRTMIADWVIPRSQNQFRRHGTGLWTAQSRRDDSFLGWVQLRLPRHSFDRELELSYRFVRRAWGSGLATEASAALIAVTFLSTDTERVFASTHTDHVASQRVMAKLGMRLAAGPLRPEQFADGFTDGDVEYELLRDQWTATRGRRASRVVARRAPVGRHRRHGGTAEMTA